MRAQASMRAFTSCSSLPPVAKQIRSVSKQKSGSVHTPSAYVSFLPWKGYIVAAFLGNAGLGATGKIRVIAAR